MKSSIGIRTKDGTILSLNHYEPEVGTDKVMIIASTAELTKEFYDSFARFMCQKGIAVIAFDFRGMGQSIPGDLKNYEANMHQWAVQDIDAVILHAKNSFPKQEIIYTGHCTGGEIVGLAQASQYINKLVLVSSALSCKKFWAFKSRMRINWLTMTIRIRNWWYGYFPGKKLGFPENFPGGVMHQYLNWCSSTNGLFDSFPDNNYRKLRIPILAFNFSDDWHSPEKAVSELHQRFANAVITKFYIKPEELGLPQIGNRGFFNNPEMETLLWNKTLQWLTTDEREKIKTA